MLKKTLLFHLCAHVLVNIFYSPQGPWWFNDPSNLQSLKADVFQEWFSVDEVPKWFGEKKNDVDGSGMERLKGSITES